MKVMFVSGSYPPVRCGVGDYVGFVSANLAKQGIKAEILTSSYRGIKHSGRNPAVNPCIEKWGILNVKKALSEILRSGAGIVHFQYPTVEYKKNMLTNVLPAVLKLIKPGIKIVQTFHEPLMGLTFFGRARLLLNMFFSDALIFVEKENMTTSPWYVKAVLAGKTVRYIPVASNIPRQKADIRVITAIRKKFAVKNKKRIFLTFGFITPVKGYEILAENVDFNKYEWIHLGGYDKNDLYQNSFVNSVIKNGIKINFTGYLSAVNTAKYLASSGMCLFPFKEGVTDRHGTYLAAANQGVYCVAFHASKKGYFEEENTFYAALGDINGFIDGMKRKVKKGNIKPKLPQWADIAFSHKQLYEFLLKK
ncbi:MAG: hypothetical protein JXR81_07500 [Candidatus Goldbacteria bacterium]|nr:hypothetical protein [Candidatus Goldiibacteriota bacterium]